MVTRTVVLKGSGSYKLERDSVLIAIYASILEGGIVVVAPFDQAYNTFAAQGNAITNVIAVLQNEVGPNSVFASMTDIQAPLKNGSIVYVDAITASYVNLVLQSNS